jgi:hypothetical protein
MIMNDLELHREKELVDLKGRMANSITEFTRGLVNREKKSDVDKQLDALGFPRGRRIARTHSTQGWMKRSRSANKRGKRDETEGAMGFITLGKAQRAVDSAEPYLQDDTEEESTDTESVSSQGIDEVDLKEMYRFACRLMRETLDIEGVCLIDIDDIDWKHARSGPDDRNTNTHKYGREFESESSILGYSGSRPFGANQRDTLHSTRWDEEAQISNLKTLGEKDEGGYIARRSPLSEESSLSVPGFPSQTSHFDDGSYVSAQAGSHTDNVGFSNQFLAKFLSENSFGKIFNEGLPDELQNFLSSGVTSAILVPIYDFEQHPFAMTCAYSTRKHKWFSDAEMKYLEVYSFTIVLIAGIWISNTFSSIEETYYYGRPRQRHIYFKHFPRTTISPPRHSRLCRVYIRHKTRYPSTYIRRYDRLLRSYSPRSHQPRPRFRQINLHRSFEKSGFRTIYSTKYIRGNSPWTY